MKTFIRWYGNKSRYISILKKHFPTSFNTYIEPFVGSGSVFLNLQPKQWIINDKNKDLVNIWTHVSKHPKLIWKYYQSFQRDFLPLSRREKLLFLRNLLETLISMKFTCKRAAYYLLVKFCSYMGLILIANKYRIPSLDSKVFNDEKLYFLTDEYFDNLLNVYKYMKMSNGIIYNLDYKDILKLANKDDFIFLDPPYGDDYTFQYNKDQNMSSSFEDELYKQLKKLDDKGVKWMMTQANTSRMRKRFKDYKIYKFRVYRGHTHSHSSELIIKNY